MPEILLTVPYAVVTADTIREVRERLAPFTLWSDYDKLAWEENSDETPEEIEYGNAYIRAQKEEAQERIDAGGAVSLASLSVTSPDYTEFSWSNDESAPLERINGCFSARVRFESAEANLAVELEVDLRSVRLRVNTDFEQYAVKESDREGYEAATIANAVREILERNIDTARLAHEVRPFKVFIGHGGDTKWEVVRDFIDAAGYDTTYFEGDDRIGRTTFEVVEQMISEASVAVIVMTGVDVLTDGRKLARQNVIHELGFSHARLGQRNTLILLEEGADEPSNIAGVTQIRFPNGDANRTKVELLAALANRKREHETPTHGGY
ncbi:nucleotide-binding protein [Microbacterium sp. ISL-59]|uniref:TIR domain-containing protein n=1 Tax=Microbacterium sp. ISL-59 TaxID=2819159 RepID=UPI001BE4F562|nr:TIR domain-containing protein [Microbacterium sp. ISL-59]MBT2496403.1 nucleotide-binding protein [Microbacterium sp. ISL-59]